MYEFWPPCKPYKNHVKMFLKSERNREKFPLSECKMLGTWNTLIWKEKWLKDKSWWKGMREELLMYCWETEPNFHILSLAKPFVPEDEKSIMNAKKNKLWYTMLLTIPATKSQSSLIITYLKMESIAKNSFQLHSSAKFDSLYKQY